MALPQVIEGTAEEILSILQGGAYAGSRLRLTVADQEDEAVGIPDPPNTITDQAHLESLLLAGLAGAPAAEMTAADWQRIREQAHARVQAQRSTDA